MNPLKAKVLGDVALTYKVLRDAKPSGGYEITPIALQEARKRFYEVATPDAVLDLLELAEMGRKAPNDPPTAEPGAEG
jgi:hypothetical protein